MTRLFGIHTEPSEWIQGEWLAVWSGAFMSDFEGQGSAHPGADHITIQLEGGDEVLVTFPEGVTFPRTVENYQQIDDAINAALNDHEKKRASASEPSGKD